jgi:carboxymethylenebutenolidase
MDSPSESFLADVLDAHLAAEFATQDLDAAMATMADDPYLIHVPVMTGGVGWDEVREFYGKVFIGHWPQDTAVQRVSRTAGASQVVDELVMSFTHDVVTRAPSLSRAPIRWPLLGLGGSRGDGLLRSPVNGLHDTTAPGFCGGTDWQQGDAPQSAG